MVSFLCMSFCVCHYPTKNSTASAASGVKDRMSSYFYSPLLVTACFSLASLKQWLPFYFATRPNKRYSVNFPRVLVTCTFTVSCRIWFLLLLLPLPLLLLGVWKKILFQLKERERERERESLLCGANQTAVCTSIISGGRQEPQQRP